MTTPNTYVILPTEATGTMKAKGSTWVDGSLDRAHEAYRAMLSASPNSGRVTAEMMEAAARAILKAEWEVAGETPEDAAWIADTVIDGIADDCEDDALAARMAARAAFESIGLTVEG